MSDHQPVPEAARCPECGAEPSHESVVRAQLSLVGYEHEDKWIACSECDNRWVCGIPIGSDDDDTWVCGACGGDFMPHFVYVYPEKKEVRVRPKCQECYWVPDDPIVLDCSTSGETIRLFIGHHTTTGDREKAKRNPID